ncbi:hypothetical protein TcWFU_008992 [Taenia crassiceps]|uniref:Uncharacterized protein n=1 Tax=Taenia crassiceps TaxID=6207 RepID=A0ABR4QTP8_9CEST
MPAQRAPSTTSDEMSHAKPAPSTMTVGPPTHVGSELILTTQRLTPPISAHRSSVRGPNPGRAPCLNSAGVTQQM